MNVKHVAFVRHGKTNYTNVFPDLTDEGKEDVLQLSQSMRKWVHDIQATQDGIIYISSPMARAQGTAHLIRSMLGDHSPIYDHDKLRSMDIRDGARAKEVFASLPKGYISYESVPAFRDEKIFETVTEVSTRAMELLKELPGILDKSAAEAAVVVSHYEVLSSYLRMAFGAKYWSPSEVDALQTAEVIYATFDNGCVRFSFRGDHSVSVLLRSL